MEKEIILRAQEVNEILTSTPKWVLRWGIFVVFILILTSIALSYFIRYPDIITADITLITINQPITCFAKNNGKLAYLLVKNNDLVNKNQIIAIIENTSKYEDVLYLYEEGMDMKNQLNFNNSTPNLHTKDSLKLGELTPNYLLVLKSLKELNHYKTANYTNKKIVLLKKDLKVYNELLNEYKLQENIYNQQLALSEKEYNKDKIIFEREFDTLKKEYLSVLNRNNLIKINISNTYIQINFTKKSILQLQLQDFQEQLKLKIEFQKNLSSLISEINKWEQRYIIKSPINGKISFLNTLTIKQNIKTSDKLFSVIPIQKQQFIGKCILPIIQTDKLAIGQNVNIKLDKYPYNENGMLQGVITNISEMSNAETYNVDVYLKNGLLTSYNKIILNKGKLNGKADIIVKNISILDRIFVNFKKLLDSK